MKKPLHKHIGHHAKKVHGHFTKYLYERDTIFATIWVFLFIGERPSGWALLGGAIIISAVVVHTLRNARRSRQARRERAAI